MVLGGKDKDGKRTDSIEVYNCHENKWIAEHEVGIKLRKPRSGFAVIQMREQAKVIVIGGNDGRV